MIFKARHNKTDQHLVLYGFDSLKQARHFNPYLVEWEEIAE